MMAETVAHSLATGSDPLLTQRHVAASITTAVFGLDSSTSVVFGADHDVLNPTGASVVSAVAPTGPATSSTSSLLRDTVQKEFLKSTFPDPDAIRNAQLADPMCAGLLTALVSGTPQLRTLICLAPYVAPSHRPCCTRGSSTARSISPADLTTFFGYPSRCPPMSCERSTTNATTEDGK